MATPASTSVASSLAALADPPLRTVDGPVVDYFFIELVNTLRASSAVAVARTKKIEQEMVEAGLLPPAQQGPPAVPSKRDSLASASSKTGGLDGKTAVDDEEEALRLRLESIGMHVGSNVAERSVICSLRLPSGTQSAPHRLCHERGLFSDTLDAIKFICKELWVACWDKQVDNLRTNHRVRPTTTSGFRSLLM